MAINKEILKKQIAKAKKQNGGKLTKSQQRTADRYLKKPSGGSKHGSGGSYISDDDFKANPLEDTEPTPTVNDEIVDEEIADEEVGGNEPTNNNGGQDKLIARIDDLAKMQEKRRISQIREAKKSALSTLAQEKEGITPAYEQARSQSRAGGQQSARNFDEYLAQRGLSNSGAGAEGSIRQEQTTRGQLGQLRQGETEAMTDIARRKQQVQSGSLADIERAGMARQESVMQGALGLTQQQQQQDFQRELGDINYDRQVDLNEIQNAQSIARDKLNNTQRIALSELNNTQQENLAKQSTKDQIAYLEKQDELVRARNSGDLSSTQLYRNKLEIDREFGIGDFKQDDIEEYSDILAGIEYRYENEDYAGAYQAYFANKAVADVELDKGIIQDLVKYRENVIGSTNIPGGRTVK